MSRPIFVLTAGRSGSQMLAEVMNLDPRVHAVHEPLPNLIRHHYRVWRGFMNSKQVHDVLSWARDDELKRTQDQGLVYFESSHFMSFFVKELQERYNAKFIHLIRNGKDFVSSGMNRNWYLDSNFKRSLRSLIFGRMNLFDYNFLQRTNFPSELLRLVPPKEAASPFEKAAWLWQEHNMHIARQLQATKADFIQIPLESFTQDPATSIQKIFAFMDLDAPPNLGAMLSHCSEKPNRTPRGEARFPNQSSWTPEQAAAFNKFAGYAQSYFNYPS